MSNTCKDVESGLTAFLDDELHGADLRDVEMHIVECDSCQELVDREQKRLGEIRRHLQRTPQAPDLLRKRLSLALDAADRTLDEGVRRQRRTLILPAISAVTAVAAMAFFLWKDIGASHGTEAAPTGQVARDAARQHLRETPLFVSSDPMHVGESATRYLESQVRAPKFSSSEVRLLGWTPAQIDGRQTATFVYEATNPTGRHRVHAHAVPVASLNVQGQRRLSIPGGAVWIDAAYGFNTVTFTSNEKLAYVFSSDMPAQSLINLVVDTDIVGTMNVRSSR